MLLSLESMKSAALAFVLPKQVSRLASFLFQIGKNFFRWSPDISIVVSVDIITLFGPVSWGCRIHWLHLCREVRLSQWVSWYDIKQSDSEASIMQELWGIWRIPLLPLLPSPLWPWVIAPQKGPINGSNRTVWHLNRVQTNDLC